MEPRALAPLALAAVAAAGCPGEEGITVTGTVVSMKGGPVAGATVRVPGRPLATTDIDGRFTVTRVRAPYDLVVVRYDGGRDHLSIYQGLTRADPKVATEAAGVERAAPGVGGTLEAYAPQPGDLTLLAFSSAEVDGAYFPVQADGSFAAAGPITWEGRNDTSGALWALQIGLDGSGLPSAYRGYWSYGPATLRDGLAAPPFALASRAFASRTVTVQVTVPPGLSLTRAVLGLSLGVNGSLVLPSMVSPAATFSYLAPDIGEAFLTAAVVAENGAGDEVTATVDFPEPDRGILLPPALTVASPSDLAPLTASTPFIWSPVDGGLYLLRLESAPGTPSVRIVTASPQATLALLADAGVTLPSGADYGWSVEAFGWWFGGVDAAAEAGGPRTPNPLFELQGRIPPSARAWRTATRQVVVP